MTPTADDLLPCPFCGEMPEVQEGSRTKIYCPRMGESGCVAAPLVTQPTLDLAISAWNTRAAPRWIPMTERKPKDGQIVAIFKPDALENDDEYETVEWNVRYNDLDISRHLWYPLPALPKEVE